MEEFFTQRSENQARPDELGGFSSTAGGTDDSGVEEVGGGAAGEPDGGAVNL